MYTVDASGADILITTGKINISVSMTERYATIKWHHGNKPITSVLRRIHDDLQYYMWAGGSTMLYDSTTLIIETRDFIIEWNKISGKVAKTFRGRRREMQAIYTSHRYAEFMVIHSAYFR